MRRTWVALLFMGVAAFGGFLSPDPWVLPMGRVGISLGYPTLAMRFGLLNLLEIGGALREGGAYVKLGYNSDTFGIAVGYSTVFSSMATVFGAVGYRSDTLEMNLGGLVRQEEIDRQAFEYEISGEIKVKLDEWENSLSFLGVYAGYRKKPADPDQAVDEYEGGVYASGTFRKVWVFPEISLTGGLMFYYDGGDFSITRNIGVIIDVTVYVDLVK